MLFNKIDIIKQKKNKYTGLYQLSQIKTTTPLKVNYNFNRRHTTEF